jgi:hypothetical protein
MKRKNCYNLFVVTLVAFCTSCTKPSFELEPGTIDEKRFVIKPQVYISDPWTVSTKAIGATDPIFMCYLFDRNNAIYNRGNALGDNMTTTFEEVVKTGDYSIYCVTGWFIGEYPQTTKDTELYQGPITLDTELYMCSAKDICLGKQDISVNASQMIYNVVVNVDHIMAKAAFLIENVPLDVTNITVTLPKQANKFKFDGTILGNTQSQTLTLVKGSEQNENGTYNWSVEETIVYPFAKEGGKMPIHLTVSNSTGGYTFKTETLSCCTKGKRIAYKTDWGTMTYSQSTQININPWTEDVIDTDFELGGAETNNNQE